MLFESTPSFWPIPILFGLTFILFIILVIWCKIFSKKITNGKASDWGALLLGGCFGMAATLTIVFCTICPSVSIVDADKSYYERYRFTSNEKFIGIGGAYIENNTDASLRLIGIGEDEGLNVVIPPHSIKRVPKLPDTYFKPVPEKQSITYRKSRRGRKPVAGNSRYLIFN